LQEEPNAKWDLLAMSAILAYNKQVHSTTGASPYTVYFGRDPFEVDPHLPHVMEEVNEKVRVNTFEKALEKLKRDHMGKTVRRFEAGDVYVTLFPL